MAFCSKCGAQLAEDTKFCPACGNAVTNGQTPEDNTAETEQKESVGENSKQENFRDKAANINNTADTTSEFDRDDIVKNKAMAILSYLWILVLVPIFAAKDSKFARYHANQGLILFITWVAYCIIEGILSAIFGVIFIFSFFPVYKLLTMILGLVNIVFVALMIIGIVNAANGRAKELPIIGKFRILK